MTILGSFHQGSEAVVLVCELHICACLKQHFCALQVPVLARKVQSPFAIGQSCIHSCPILEQCPGDLLVMV